MSLMRKVTGRDRQLIVIFLVLEALVVAVNTRQRRSTHCDVAIDHQRAAATSTTATSTTSELVAEPRRLRPPAPTPTTIPAPRAVTIDLTATLPRLEPHQIASFPIVAPGDLFPTAYATPAPDNRIAILDDVTGVLRFIDGTTRMDITQYGTPVPTIGSTVVHLRVRRRRARRRAVRQRGRRRRDIVAAYARNGDRYERGGPCRQRHRQRRTDVGSCGVVAIGDIDADAWRTSAPTVSRAAPRSTSTR